MERNWLGVVGCVLGFLSLVLPWWALDYSMGSVKLNMSLYLYSSSVGQGINSAFGLAVVDWYNWAALGLLLVGAIFVFLSSVVLEDRRMIALLGTLLSILAVVVFPVGLQMRLSSYHGSLQGISLFSTGVISISSTSYLKFYAYLTFGFWLALAATFFMFWAWTRYPQEKFEEEEEPEPAPAPYWRPQTRPPPRRPYRY